MRFNNSYFKKSFKKPDGRNLYLYSRSEISDSIKPTSPGNNTIPPGHAHLRYHPLRGEWVAYASHRQNRTFLPPKDYSPLAKTKSESFPTELPDGEYEIAVFENLFPSLNEASEDSPKLIVPTRPAKGVCEVVVFTDDPDTSLGALSVDRIKLILEVFGERTKELGKLENIKYVLPFENRGVEMGVTLHHPHGQLYAYPFVPSIPATMHKNMREFWHKNQKGLLEDIIEQEIKENRRIIHRQDGTISFIPVFARYPYETWIAPERKVAWIHELSNEELTSLASCLKTVIQKHDNLWNRPQPYLMLFYQAPLEGDEHPESHFHIQILPPYRTKDKLKYLAGTELGAGMFVNDSLPEEKAIELKSVAVEQ